MKSASAHLAKCSTAREETPPPTLAAPQVLLRDPAALEQRRNRWREWRNELFTTEKTLANIDEVAALLEEAQQRNFERWPILGRRVQPGQVNPRGYRDRDRYEKEVTWMRQWLIDRLAWLDAEFLEAPTFSVKGPRVSPETELTIINPNGEGDIYYTINGPDPITFAGRKNRARTYDFLWERIPGVGKTLSCPSAEKLTQIVQFSKEKDLDPTIHPL